MKPKNTVMTKEEDELLRNIFGPNYRDLEPEEEEKSKTEKKKRKPKYKVPISATRGDALRYFGDRYDIPADQKNNIHRHNYSTEYKFCLSDHLYLFAERTEESLKGLLDDLVD